MVRKVVAYFLRLSAIRFALTGVLNTAVGLSVIFSLKWFLQMGDTAANLLGYAVGLWVSYVINSRWTFQYRESLLPVLPRYALVVLVAYLANLGSVHLCIRWLGLDSYLAQTLGVIPYAGLSYLLLRWCVFGKARRSAATQVP